MPDPAMPDPATPNPAPDKALDNSTGCGMDIAITGMGGLCAMGASPAAMAAALEQPPCPRQPASLLDERALPYPFYAVPEGILAAGERSTARATLTLARHAVRQACLQAQLSCDAESILDLPTAQNPHIGQSIDTTAQGAACTGLVMGTTAGSALHFLDGYAALRAGQAPPFADVNAYLHGNIALVLAQDLHTQGPCITVTNACTSGADALGLAADMLRSGQCERVVCGGADALSMVPHTGFIRLMIYADQPCRPFDAERKGLNLGEGAACFVVEDARTARARNVPILGFVRGYGAASDAHHFTAPHPEGRGLTCAIDQALRQAGISADDLAFINVHGTATAENDKVEGGVIRRLFPHIPVWASKGSTGHTLGAAGSLEALLCLLALHARRIPPSFGFATPDPLIGISPTRCATPITKGYALSLSLGFGGGNAALVLERSENAHCS